MAGSDGFERGLEVGVGVDLIHFGELSHEPTRQRERTMRGFKSMGQAQRFVTVHGRMKYLIESLLPFIVVHLHRPSLIPRVVDVSTMLAERVLRRQPCTGLS